MSCNAVSFESSTGKAKFRTPSILPLKGPSLEDLKLVNILNAETCPPISFKDFTTFVTEKELTTENLLFVIWYKSYEVRWRALDQATRDKVPVPSTKLGDRYDPFRTVAPDYVAQPVSEQPMREEVVRAYATFLKQDGSRPLGISDELRRYAQTSLARSSAPECFLPLYEEVYHTLETQSLPHFLSHVSANVNRPKQLFWYYVGAFDLFLGIAIYLVLTLTLSSRHFGLRATRLPSTIFAAFGSMQMYSAYRGFCSQVWNRKSRQLWPWELDAVGDEELSIQSKHETDGGSECALSPIPISAASPLDTRQSISPHPSFFSENIFTPTAATREMTLSPEVYPLTELNEPINPGSIPETEKIEEMEMEMSEVQRHQLAIRRSTIKVPDASLAFPISEDDELGDLATRKPSHRSSAFESLRPSISSLASGSFRRPSPSLTSPLETPVNRRSDISPFEEAPPSILPKTEANVSTTSVTQGTTTPGRPDLTVLLDKFRFTGQARSAEDNRPKMFGPESPVQDERVRELFESVVRDILVVGVLSGVIWVALCLAVPCAGLV